MKNQLSLSTILKQPEEELGKEIQLELLDSDKLLLDKQLNSDHLKLDMPDNKEFKDPPPLFQPELLESLPDLLPLVPDPLLLPLLLLVLDL